MYNNCIHYKQCIWGCVNIGMHTYTTIYVIHKKTNSDTVTFPGVDHQLLLRYFVPSWNHSRKNLYDTFESYY